MSRKAGAVPGEGMALPPLGDALEFMRLVWTVDRRLQATSGRMTLARGITARQQLVIRLVGRFPGISAGQLAEILHVHPSTLTGLIGPLERRGLLSRRADPRDARRVALGLTAKGRESGVDATVTVESAIQQLLSSLPRNKVLATREVLAMMARALETRVS